MVLGNKVIETLCRACAIVILAGAYDAAQAVNTSGLAHQQAAELQEPKSAAPQDPKPTEPLVQAPVTAHSTR